MTRQLVRHKPRRLPRKGFFFSLARIAGLLCKAGGLLLLAIAVIGFIVMLVSVGPTMIGAMHYLHQKMAGFVFLISLTYLLIFPIVGLVGAVTSGIGFALGYIGTEPAVPAAINTSASGADNLAADI